MLISVPSCRLFTVLCIALSLSVHTSYAAVQDIPALSEKATLSLITCGQGEELYSIFGHTALRVCDPELSLDRIYNYGVFNFHEPWFIWKFLRGELLYRLDIEDNINRFLYVYHYEKREVIEQVLSFSHKEVNDIFLFLEENRKPENCSYLYDFVRDNCTTRVRDVLTKTDVENYILKPISIFTYRKHLSDCLKPLPWTDLGINLLLGARLDKLIDINEAMFLPGLLMEQTGNTIKTDNNSIVLKTNLLLKGNQPIAPGIWVHPIVISVIFCCIGIYLFFWRKNKKKLNRIYDILLFTAVGITGFIIAFMWFFTRHYGTADNWNLIIISPIHIIYAVMGWRLSPKILKIYAYYIILSVLLFVTAVIISGQSIQNTVWIITVAIIFRALYVLKRAKK